MNNTKYVSALEDTRQASAIYTYLQDTKDQWKSDPEVKLYYIMLKYVLCIPMSLDEIAQVPGLNLTRERVRQIQEKAFSKIRRRYKYDTTTASLTPKSGKLAARDKYVSGG